MNDLYSLASIGNILIGLLLLIGGYMAIRSGKHRQAGEIQDQVINALKAELEALQRRLDILERENARLNLITNTIKRAINQRGMIISIDGDMVEIRDQRSGQSSSYTHIQETNTPRKASQPAPRSQWARKPWTEETIADMPKTEQE